MPEWLASTPETANPSPTELITRLTLGFVLGCVVAGIYRLTCGETRERPESLTATLVLLTILIGMVTLVIGNSVARAFGLVGALSIVRFRTVVADTRDTAFVIFAVAVGMAAGAGYTILSLIGIPIVALAAFLFRSSDTTSMRGALDFVFSLRLGIGHDPKLLRPTLDRHLLSYAITGSGTAKQGTAISLTYVVCLRSEDSAVGLVSDLNMLEGVHDINLQQV